MFDFLFGKRRRRNLRKVKPVRRRTRRTTRADFGMHEQPLMGGMQFGTSCSQQGAPLMGGMQFGTHEPLMSRMQFGLEESMKTHEMLISFINKIPNSRLFFPLTRKNRILAKLPSPVRKVLFNFIPADGGVTKDMLIAQIKKANDLHSMATKFGFGKKRRMVRRKSSKKNKKPSKAILRMCKKYRIKATKKMGKKRVYKSLTILKRLIAKKKKMMKRKMNRR